MTLPQGADDSRTEGALIPFQAEPTQANENPHPESRRVRHPAFYGIKARPPARLEMFLWILLSVTAGICEETIFRGYLQKQLHAWLKSAPIAVVLSAAAFGAGHIYQGTPS